MLIRHNPLNLLNELNELSDLLEGNGKRSSLRDDASKVEGSRWAPAVDIKEEPSQFIFYVDVPGVDPKAIEISMENNILTLKGAREEGHSIDAQNAYHRIERVKGLFYCRFTLPETADAEQIRAKSKNGVLEIVIGKKKIAQSRKIEVCSDE